MLESFVALGNAAINLPFVSVVKDIIRNFRQVVFSTYGPYDLAIGFVAHIAFPNQFYFIFIRHDFLAFTDAYGRLAFEIFNFCYS